MKTCFLLFHVFHWQMICAHLLFAQRLIRYEIWSRIADMILTLQTKLIWYELIQGTNIEAVTRTLRADKIARRDGDATPLSNFRCLHTAPTMILSLISVFTTVPLILNKKNFLISLDKLRRWNQSTAHLFALDFSILRSSRGNSLQLVGYSYQCFWSAHSVAKLNCLRHVECHNANS